MTNTERDPFAGVLDERVITSTREAGFARGMGVSIQVMRALGNDEAANLLTAIILGDDWKRLAACTIEERKALLDRYLQLNVTKGAA
jgi:hypothetical protein